MKFFFDVEYHKPDNETLIFAQSCAGSFCSAILKFNKSGVRLFDTGFPINIVDYQPGTTRVKIIGVDIL